MISAERFARERTSYWHDLLPRMEPFIRALNLSVGRFSKPIAAEVSAERRAFVAELGFELFRQRVRTQRTNSEAAFLRVRALIASLSSLSEEGVAAPSKVERREAQLLEEALQQFVAERGSGSLSVDPDVPGCGIIDRAAADLMISRPRLPDGADATSVFDRLLYEVKAVERGFRAGDIRQVITYAALMTAAERPPLVVGLVNPRLGIYFECGLDSLAMDLAGMGANELLNQIIFDISTTDVSL